MKQRRTFAFRVDDADVLGRTILEARAGQVPFIHGYVIDMSFVTTTAFSTDADSLSGTVMLQGNPQAPTTPFNMNTDPYLALANFQGNIGVLSKYVELIRLPSSTTLLTHDFNYSSGYMPCDFAVPGVWVTGQHSTVGSVASRVVATISLLFDWVDRSPMQVAALYTSWGIDAVDAQEREATAAGEIRFGQSLVGEHSKPTLIS